MKRSRNGDLRGFFHPRPSPPPPSSTSTTIANPFTTRNHTHLSAAEDFFPTLTVTSYNQNGGNFFPTRNIIKRQKSNTSIFNFARNSDVFFTQETHTDAEQIDDQGFTIADPIRLHLRGTRAYHNPLDTATAGTAIHTGPSFVKRYAHCTTEHFIHVAGYLQSLLITHPNGRTIRYINYYGPNTDWKFHGEMVRILLRIPKATFMIIGGDFNFVLDNEDCLSEVERNKEVAVRKLWIMVEKRFGLSEVHQPDFTRVQQQVSKDGNISIEAARLDRFYVNFSDTHFNKYDINCYLQNTPFALSSTLLALIGEIPTDSITEWRRATPSDHLGISLAIRTLSKGHLPPKIPKWVGSSPRFLELFEDCWLSKRHFPSDAAKCIKLLSKVMFDCSRRVIKEQTRKIPNSLAKVRILSKAIHLLNTRSNHRQERLRALTDRYSFLNNLIEVTDDTVSTDRLEKVLNEIYSKQGMDSESILQSKSNNRFSFTPQSNTILPKDRKCVVRMRAALKIPPATDPGKISTIIKDFWSQIFKGKKLVYEAITKVLNGYSHKIEATFAGLTLADIVHSIAISPNSSNGPDGIPFAAIRAISKYAAPIILKLAQYLSHLNSRPPDGFNDSAFHLIPKKGNSDLVGHARPISITNVFNRIVARALKSKLAPHLEPLLSKNQKGFISGRTGEDNIDYLNGIFSRAKDLKSKTFLLFVDFEKAFDSISHQYLFRLLKHVGVPAWARNLIGNLMSDVTAEVYTPSPSGQKFSISKGVKQGCPLSPLLFALAIDPLLRELEKNPNLDNRAFADDLAISFNDVRDLTFIKAKCEAFKKGTGLQLSIPKTVLLSSTPFDEKDIEWIKKSDWKDLELEKRAVYLGILFGTGNPSQFDNYSVFTTVFNKVIKRIDALTPRCKGLSVERKIQVINTYVVPLLGYIHNFYVTPIDMRRQMQEKIRKFVDTINSIPYELLLGHSEFPSFNPSLRDFVVDGMARKVKRHPHLENIHQDTLIKHQEDTDNVAEIWLDWDTDIHFHRAYACRYAKQYEGVIILPGKSVADYYNAMRNSIFHRLKMEEAFKTKLVRYDLDHKIDNITRGFKSLDPKRKYVNNIILKVFYNSLPTARRLRYLHRDTAAVNPHLPADTKCFLCGKSEDSVEHMLGLVHTYKAKTGSKRKCKDSNCNHPLSSRPNRPDRCLVKTIPACQVVWDFIELVNKREKLNISYNSSTMLLASDEPDKKTYRTIGLIIYTIWQARKFMELSSNESGLHMLLTIYAGMNHSNGKVALKKLAKDKRRKEKVEISRLYVLSLISKAKPDVIFIFTDGSALGNPGPTGAGFVVYRNGVIVFRSGVGVGEGNNNLGEIVALGLALRYCMINFTDQTIHILSDSEYALGVARGKKYKNMPAMGRNLSNALIRASSSNSIELHWVAAHADIEGNEAADIAAKQGAKRAFAGDSLPLHHLTFDFSPLGVQLLSTAKNIPSNPNPCYCSVCMVTDPSTISPLEHSNSSNLEGKLTDGLTNANRTARTNRTKRKAPRVSLPTRRSKRLRNLQPMEEAPMATDAPT